GMYYFFLFSGYSKSTVGENGILQKVVVSQETKFGRIDSFLLIPYTFVLLPPLFLLIHFA
ncbi:MAG: hypothetical protein ACLSUN_13590, partial [Anaerobutyricum soehngenii]